VELIKDLEDLEDLLRVLRAARVETFALGELAIRLEPPAPPRERVVDRAPQALEPPPPLPDRADLLREVKFPGGIR
jgi:hypothetical protein